MPILSTGRLLIQSPGGTAQVLSDHRLFRRATPILRAADTEGREVVAESEWHLTDLTSDALKGARALSDHPWDQAHAAVQLIRGTLRTLAPDAPHFVEPDLIHRRLLPTQGPAPAAEPTVAAGAHAGQGLNTDYPPYAGDAFDPAWHLDRGGFKQAWQLARGDGVRIAHLDTGFDPHQSSMPRHLLPAEGRNYFSRPPDGNVVDPGNELINAGHGTATLALLAGGHVDLYFKDAQPTTYHGDIGGAPEATVIPVRIGGVLGGSVVHIHSQSMADGLLHALGDRTRKPADVVSLSHGGLPTKAWIEAVNQLYDAGIVVVAASGDNFQGYVVDIASHFTVYPSACYRAVTATGETFARGPYTSSRFLAMQGSWGPEKVMHKAIAGHAPNVPWMRMSGPNDWDMNGGGTSASAPQIAAACALWLSAYGAGLPRDWRRVAACRHALFETAGDRELNLQKIGVGVVNAQAMLDPTLAARLRAEALQPNGGTLRQIERDTVRWPFLQILFGLDPPGSGVDEMYHLEAQQLAYRSQNRELQDAIADHSVTDALPEALARSLREDFLREPDMSESLRRYLRDRAG